MQSQLKERLKKVIVLKVQTRNGTAKENKIKARLRREIEHARS